MGTGCCSSELAVEAGVLEVSLVGASVAAVDPSAAGSELPAASPVDTFDGVAVDAPGVPGDGALTAAVGASGAVATVGLDAAAVDSDAAVDSGATNVAFG